MESFLLLIIAVLLFYDLKEQRQTRDETALLLQRVRQAERRIKRTTDESVARMLDEVRKDAFSADWGNQEFTG